MSPDVLVGLGADACPRRRVRDLEAEPPVGQGEDVRRGRTAAPCVRDHHDLELQPLGGVDREEPDRVGALLLRDRVGFLRPHRLLPLDEPHEALDLRAPELLVRPGQPGELAQVRVPAATVRAREHGEVVVVLRDDALAEELERGGRGHLQKTLIALLEREEQPPIALREVGGQRTLQCPEHRLALRLGSHEDQRVVRHADERRREHRQQRLVVVAVVEEAQVGEQVGHLLLTEVVATCGAVRRQADRPKLLLEPLGVGPGGKEEHDLAGRRDTRIDELADAPGDVTCLRPAPVHPRLARGRLVRHEELERVPERGGVGRGRLEPLELVAELAAEQLVDGVEYLGTRPVVPREREDCRRGAPPFPEYGDVGMAEAVDRLELVADDEEVGVRPLAEQVEQLGLEPVRVLELVDHDRAEPPALPFADRLVVAEQVARAKLQVLEVERRFALLGGAVGGGERRQELLEQLAVARGELLERRRHHRVARFGEPGGTRTARLQVGQREEPLGERRHVDELERRAGGRTLGVRRGRVIAESQRGVAERLDPLGQRRPRSRLEHELPPGRAECRVHVPEHLTEPHGAVGREQLPPVRLVGRAELLERSRERLGLEDERLRLVEHAERGVDSRREWVCAKDAPAEAVDRGHPRAVELEREIRATPLDQRRTDACPELAGRSLRVRDHEERVDVEPVLRDRPDEPLDEDGGLPRPCARGDEDAPARIDRSALLIVREGPHGRSLRHIRQRSHQCGHSPPCGSCRTSPARIRSTSPTAVARAASTASSNASAPR